NLPQDSAGTGPYIAHRGGADFSGHLRRPSAVRQRRRVPPPGRPRRAREVRARRAVRLPRGPARVHGTTRGERKLPPGRQPKDRESAMKTIKLLATLLVLHAWVATAGSDPAARCVAAKIKASGKQFAAIAKCRSKAVLAQTPVDPGCLQ